MCESDDIKKGPVVDLTGIFCEHSCGAVDARECNAMKHLIIAEIRKSNAPSWVAQELEKKLSCRGCWNCSAGRPFAIHLSGAYDSHIALVNPAHPCRRPEMKASAYL
ncbi:MAG TPA: hypothetical protein PLJ25_05895 [Methanothrix sp.]|nr:hypothetical protein [Methanothrix sp.]